MRFGGSKSKNIYLLEFSSKLFNIALILFVLLCKLGVVNWSVFSAQYRQESRVPYSLTQCLQCSEI